jgi:hypothetical protein
MYAALGRTVIQIVRKRARMELVQNILFYLKYLQIYWKYFLFYIAFVEDHSV